jgi:hypothetical protein
MGFFRFWPNEPPLRRGSIAVRGEGSFRFWPDNPSPPYVPAKKSGGSQRPRPLAHKAMTRPRRTRPQADAAVPADRSVLRLFADARRALQMKSRRAEKQAWAKLARYLLAAG